MIHRTLGGQIKSGFRVYKEFTRNISSSQILANRLYTEEHEWVDIKGNVATFGITDYAQKALGDVVYIELPSVGQSVQRKDQVGAVESVKAASDIYSPISGTILKVNSVLEAEPSAFKDGWIAQIQLENATPSVEGLLTEKEYAKLIE